MWYEIRHRLAWGLACIIGAGLVLATLVRFGNLPALLGIGGGLLLGAGVAGGIVDARRRRHIEQVQQRLEASQESENRYRRLVEQSPDPIVVHQAGKIVYVSPSGIDLIGAEDASQLVGQPVLSFVHPGDRAKVRQRIALMEQGESVELIAERLIRLDDTVIDVEATAMPVTYGGAPAVQVMLRDVTERKRYEQHLKEAKEQAEDLARLKTAFLANMSHEIRTPLTGIIGFASVLDTELSDEHREIITLIRHSSERLMETLNSVLDLARLEAGALDLEPEPLELGHEAEDAARLFHARAEQKGVVLRTALPPEEIYAHLDRAALHRVLSNLLSNAIKFTNEGHVTLGLARDVEEACLRVEDTGVGISEDFLPYLFDEFRQESKGLARSHTGSGLGLSITRRLVERMEGTIEVESTKGVGTCFTIRFPCCRPSPTTS